MQIDRNESPVSEVGESGSNPEIKKWFRRGRWNVEGGETHSGSGSTLRYTENLRRELPAILSKYNVRTLLDAPCGDFNWMRMVELGDVKYVGMDIVDDIVSDNRQQYATDKRVFLAGDITRSRLPRADAMLCRDCLFHLTYGQVSDFFSNFLRSEIPLLLLTSHLLYRNKDIDRAGHFRQLNMRRPPFGFPEPLATVEDWIGSSASVYRRVAARSDRATDASVLNGVSR